MITQEETWALSSLTALSIEGQNELNRRIAARQSLVKLLEEKYKAKFDEQKGQFTKKAYENYVAE